MSYVFQAVYAKEAHRFTVRAADLKEARDRARRVAPRALAIVLRGTVRQS